MAKPADAVVEVKLTDLPVVKHLIQAIKVMDTALMAAYNIDPESHATKSRDYGRGFSEALRVVREAIDREMAAIGHSAQPDSEPVLSVGPLTSTKTPTSGATND